MTGSAVAETIGGGAGAIDTAVSEPVARTSAVAAGTPSEACDAGFRAYRQWTVPAPTPTVIPTAAAATATGRRQTRARNVTGFRPQRFRIASLTRRSSMTRAPVL